MATPINLKDFPIKFDTTELFRPEKWDESYETIENVNQTEKITKSKSAKVSQSKFNEEVETILHMSLDDKKELGYIYANILFGFYRCHINHLPLIITPDDIWVLIIQSFSNHVNENSKELKDLLVNYDGKRQLEVEYPINDIKEITKEI